MLDPAHPIARLLEEDRRYPLEAYVFLFEALQYALEVLKMGADQPTEPFADEESPPAGNERHVSGREL